MTTPTSMGHHGGTVTSCSPYAYPGFAEICILLRTWSTVTPGTCELAFLIKKKNPQLPGYTHPAGCSHRTSHSTSAVAGRGGPTSSTAKAPMTASSCQPAKNRWGMPSTRATTLPHTGATKTPRRAWCPRDTALSPSRAYRATQTSNRQPERPYTPTAVFKQLRLRARNTRLPAQQ